ncbi:MAG TPA: peptidylprolyl isomerase [Candidatus Limnocylindrales bacterium]|nr:peptidylprolyl isomerase [Candidatus Limnocylindrales bacterium]
MTFRAKPVVRGSGRSGWNSGDRRTFLLNAGFVAAIVVSLLLLVGYTAWSWYDDHFGAAATVDGTTITKDELRTRLAIESFRIDYTESRIQTLLTAGRITDATATSQIQFLEQRRSSLGVLTLERLIDATIQRRLADEEGLSVSEADIDAQLIEEATTDEERHGWVIEVEPEDDEETGEPGAAEKSAAREKAEAALAELRGGKSWEDVAKTVSTAASAAQNGDLGWLPLESGFDEPFMTALFAATQGEPTDVIEGEDGIFRIGRVTEIAPTTIDDTFTARILDKEIELADYREAVRADLIRIKLDEKVVADLSAPSLQRHVLQIRVPVSATPMPDGVKVRHILFSPKDDPGGADDLDENDPAWAAAEAEARAAYDELKADITKFDAMARRESDEGSAASTGGKLPYYNELSAIDDAFADAIFAEGLEPGDLLEPFRSAFGWHVVQFMRPYGEGEKAWLETIRQQALDGADFAQLATDQGEGEEAEDGGDIGWVAVGQLGEALEDPIFGAEIGEITEVVAIPDDGAYLFKVLAEEEREATDEQIEIFESTGFSNWYAEKKAAADITKSGSAASATE